MNTRTNILLIGMPGAGKTTVGRILSQKTGLAMIDTDRLIESREGISLQEIISKNGLDYFLCLEEDTLKNLNIKNHIISPGGSAIYSESAMLHLKQISVTVYLKSSVERLLRNIRNFDSRGIVFKPGQSFEDLYNERCPLYEKYSDIRILTDGSNPNEIARAVLRQFK